MVFLRGLSESKSPQLSRILRSILADLNNAVDQIVSTCSLISKSSNPFINPLKMDPSAPITISITGIFMFHSFLVLEQGPDYYYYYFNYYINPFSHQRQLGNFHWSPSNIKSPQVSRTFLSILVDLLNSLVSIHPSISNSSSSFFWIVRYNYYMARSNYLSLW